jgi:DNA polymerase III delta prime subunit
MVIAKQENFPMDAETANHLIESSGNDIRQVINNLQMWNANPEDIKKNAGVKDDKVMINNFEAASRLLNSAPGGILE